LSRRASVVLDETTSGACVDHRYMTNVDGIFSCGNVLHIHDLADWASDEGERAGTHAAAFALGEDVASERDRVRIEPGAGVRYVVPQTAQRTPDELLLSFRVNEPSDNRTAEVVAGGQVLATESLRHAHPATMVQMRVRCEDGLDVDRLEVRLA
ncbi:MAG: pyridine nucleotide-disulfide oxidoreductase, partial [Candidatus Bipolaricaulia bacterium]